MKKFEFLDHPADLKIKAFGKTKEELFLNMLLGMEESLRPELTEKKDRQTIKINSLDLEILLADFLSQALYLNHINQAIYTGVKFKKLADNELEGELIGQKVESFGEEIKAVTYHDLKIIQKNNNRWEAIVLFDV
jgi:SHS2 domain-containing protein